MEPINFTDADDAAHFLAAARIEREALERDLKTVRDRSKAYVIQAVTRHGVSVAKASELSGHGRQSITLWLQIHNAEEKGRKTRATGE